MVNHNVLFTFAVRITDGVASGVWASSVLSTYVNILCGDDDQANERVGYAQAIQGTFLAAAALPAGWLAMSHRRDSILRVFAAVTLAAIATTSAALLLDVPYKYQLLCCGLALWGVAQANAPVLDALFADSVPTGNRSKLYTWLHMSYIVSQGLGPGVGAAMFYLSGNVWRLAVLQRVMLAGMALALLPACLLLGFDDDKALGAESEGLLRAPLLPAGREGRRSEEGSEDGEVDEEAGGGRRGSGSVSGSVGGSRAPAEAEADGGDGDYRRPFLEAWSADVERVYRSQACPALSPARPVTPHAGSAFSPGPAAYSPPEPTSPDAADGTGPPGPAASPSPADARVVSHAVVFSPASTTPTDRSPFASPSAGSPRGGEGERERSAAGGAAGGGAAATGGSSGGSLIGVAAAAAGLRRAEDEQWMAQQSGRRQQQQTQQEAVAPAVDAAGAGGPAAEGGQPTGWSGGAGAPVVVGAASAARAAARAACIGTSRSVSIGGGSVPAIDSALATAAAAGAAGAAEADEGGGGSGGGGGGGSGGGSGGGGRGEDGGDSGSAAPSVSGDSLPPSELSFSSMPTAPGGYRPAQARAYSRTASSSGGGGGPAAATPAGLLPYPEEDPAEAEADGSEDPSTPTLTPRGADDDPRCATPPPPQLLPPPLPARAQNGGGPARGRRLWGAGPPGGGPGAGVGADSHLSRGSAHNGPPRQAVVSRGRDGAGQHGGALPERRRRPGAATGDGGFPPSELNKRRFLCLSMAWIPGVLALTDCVMGLASGMTIKFFPIFFKDQVQLSPMYVNLMYCAIPLCLSAAAFGAQRQSRLLGRVGTMVVNRGIGISVLFWIGTHTNRWHQQWLMVPVYILRTSIMNSIYPLQKSILMDFVPKESRAAWNSLEAVTSFGWSGSAALGGWLIHRFGFQATFLITASLQCAGWTLSMLLLPIVPRHEAGLQQQQQQRAAGRRTAAVAAPGSGGGGRSDASLERRKASPPSGRGGGPRQGGQR